MVDQQAALSIPTVILAFCSLIACLSVCISVYNIGYRPCQCERKKKDDRNGLFLTPSRQSTQNNSKKTHSLTMMNIIVFWMCIVDGCHMIPIIVNWIPQLIPSNTDNNWFYSKFECTIIGVVAQFCCIQSPLWHILLAYHLGYLLCGGKLQRIHEQRQFHYTLVVLIPIIATIVPFFLMPKNGYKENDLDQHDKDCWVVGWSQYIFIGAITISLVFHYVVLIIAVIQFKKYKAFIAFSFQYYQIVIKLSRFVAVYTMIRFFPLIERIWEIHGGVPYWLILLQHLSIAILGLGNAIVWFWNQRNDSQFYMRYTRNLKVYNQKATIIEKFKANNFTLPSTLNSTSPNNGGTEAGIRGIGQDESNESLSNTTIDTITATATETGVNYNVGNLNNNHDSNTDIAGDV